MPRLEVLIPRYSKMNSGQNYIMKIATEFHKNVAKFKYFGVTLTDQNGMQKEITSQLNVRNACHQLHPESFVFYFGILKHKDEIHRILILPVFLYGFESWSLTLREEHRLTELKDRCQGRHFSLKGWQ
jgi:hypothetical protein